MDVVTSETLEEIWDAFRALVLSESERKEVFLGAKSPFSRLENFLTL